MDLNDIVKNRPEAWTIIGLFRRAEMEAAECIKAGDAARLPQLVGLMHLSLSHCGALQPQEREPFLRYAADALRRCFALAPQAEERPMESTSPFAFVVSYPRSGNTLATQMLNTIFQGQILENMDGSRIPFSKRCYPAAYPLVRIIKDHVVRDYYDAEKCILVVRDGRDALISLGYMTLQQKLHDFRKRHELPALIRWFSEHYAFGDWASHAKSLSALSAKPEKLLLKYDDLRSDRSQLVDAARFVDPGHRIPDHWFQYVFDSRGGIAERLKADKSSAAQWGHGEQPAESDDIFYAWSRNRQNSNWRTVFDAEARRAFHETGATEFLMRFGFETDEDWWKG